MTDTSSVSEPERPGVLPVFGWGLVGLTGVWFAVYPLIIAAESGGRVLLDWWYLTFSGAFSVIHLIGAYAALLRWRTRRRDPASGGKRVSVISYAAACSALTGASGVALAGWPAIYRNLLPYNAVAVGWVGLFITALLTWAHYMRRLKEGE